MSECGTNSSRRKNCIYRFQTETAAQTSTVLPQPTLVLKASRPLRRPAFITAHTKSVFNKSEQGAVATWQGLPVRYRLTVLIVKKSERISCIKSAPSGRQTRLTRPAKNRNGQVFPSARNLQKHARSKCASYFAHLLRACFCIYLKLGKIPKVSCP